MKYKFIWFAVLALALSSCHKDVDDENTQSETTSNITIPFNFSEIDGTILGYVYDENNEPVADATVGIYSDQTSTNSFGVFRLEDAKMDPQGTLVSVSKDGFLTNSDYVYPNDLGSGTSKVQLRIPKNTGSFDGTNGGQVILGEDGFLNFESNTISLLNGSLYSETVSVDVVTIDQGNSSFNDIIPGSLVGFDSESGNVVLGNLGTFSINLTGSSDEELQLISNKTIEIKYPIATDQLLTAPEETSIWLLDENTGIWNLKGKAQKEGDFYIATVDQDGHWMFADPYYLSQFCARLVTNAGLPAKNFSYRFKINNQICGHGISDADGYVCSKLPKEEDLTLEVIHPFCVDEVITTINIDPLGDVENRGDLNVNIEEDFRSGRILCANDNFPNATLILKSNDNTALLDPEEDGTFELNLNSILCNSNSTYSIFAINNEDGNVSPVLDLEESNIVEMRLDVCGSPCEFMVEFELAKIDFCLSGNYDVATVVVTGGSGNYEYKWQDGGEGISNSNLVTNQDLCVEITDLSTGCSLDFCGIIPEYTRLQLDDIRPSNIACQQNSGVIDIELSGGVEPYSLLWDGPVSLQEGLERQENLPPGEYSVVVRDANNCTLSAFVTVYDITNPIDSSTDEFCDNNVITILEGEGYAPYEYTWSTGENTNELTIFNPGTYVVTVSDTNGCTRSKSFTINNVGVDIDFNPQYDCSGEDVAFESLALGNGYYFIPEGESARVNLVMINQVVYVPILESGYNYNLGVIDSDTGCEVEVNINLSHFEGLDIEAVQNTSCIGCSDGEIIVLFDETADCTLGCNSSDYIIISKENGSTHSSGELAAGEYYVVALDDQSGCYVAHEEFVIE